MLLLIIGLTLFLGIHSTYIWAPKIRARYRQQSLARWKIVYSLVSIIGLALIIIGYGQERLSPTFLYFPPYWLRHVVFLLMVPVFVLFLAPYFPGMFARLVPHPQLVSVKIWAFSHLLVNGNLADVLLFGSFLIWAVISLMTLKRLPADNPPNQPEYVKETAFNDVILLTLGVALYVGFLMILHRIIIGIPLINF